MKILSSKIGLIVVFFIFLLVFAACNQPTEVQDIGCKDNNPPLIGDPSFYMDGIGVAYPYEFYADDEIFVAFKYLDEDCNLAGGKIYIKVVGWDSWRVVEKFGYDVPCDYRDAPEPIGFDWRLADEAFEPGYIEFDAAWVDGCGDPSNIIRLGFRILAQ